MYYMVYIYIIFYILYIKFYISYIMPRARGKSGVCVCLFVYSQNTKEGGAHALTGWLFPFLPLCIQPVTPSVGGVAALPNH